MRNFHVSISEKTLPGSGIVAAGSKNASSCRSAAAGLSQIKKARNFCSGRTRWTVTGSLLVLVILIVEIFVKFFVEVFVIEHLVIVEIFVKFFVKFAIQIIDSENAVIVKIAA